VENRKTIKRIFSDLSVNSLYIIYITGNVRIKYHMASETTYTIELQKVVEINSPDDRNLSDKVVAD